MFPCIISISIQIINQTCVNLIWFYHIPLWFLNGVLLRQQRKDQHYLSENFTTILSWLKAHSQEKIKMSDTPDGISFFDNNQVIIIFYYLTLIYQYLIFFLPEKGDRRKVEGEEQFQGRVFCFHLCVSEIIHKSYSDRQASVRHSRLHPRRMFLQRNKFMI